MTPKAGCLKALTPTLEGDMDTIPLTIPQCGMVRHLSERHWDMVVNRCGGVRSYERGEVICEHLNRLEESLLVLEGMIGRHIPNVHAERNHLVAVEVPGDFADLHAFPLKRLDHDVVALSTTKVAVFSHKDLRELIDGEPALARELWALTLVDAAIHRHWAYRTGALRALANVANLLAELDIRLRSGGVEEAADGLPLQLTQTDIGDACGLSSVHVNRVLRELREANCARLGGGRLQVLDRAALHRVGNFDPSYLYLPD